MAAPAARPALAALAFAAAMLVATGADAAHGERKKGGGLSYTQLPTLTATVSKPDGRRGVLAVEVGVDVADAALRTRAEQLGPVLRDAYLQFLLTYAAALAPAQLPSADIIGAGLQRATDRVLGRPGAVLLLSSILVN